MAGYFKGNGLTVIKIAPFSAFEFYFYEVFKSNLFPGKTKSQLNYLEKLVAGGLTGVAASTIVYPIDLLKTYMTINIDSAKKLTMWGQTQEIMARDGFFGLYRGWGMSMIGIAPFIGIKMTSFDFMTALTVGKDPEQMKKIPKRKMIYLNLFNGAMAGTIAVTATYPTDLVRRLLQLNGTPGHSYTGLADCVQQLYKNEGVPGFYKGLWATYLKVAPMTAILFLCNEGLKRLINI